MQVTCQYTGVVFEATSKRQKNHPKVSQLLNDLAQAGPAYGAAKQRLTEAKELGMTDIDDIIEYARTGARAMTDTINNQRRLEEQRRREADDTRRARAEQRRIVNAILREAGYRWHREDEESMDAFGANAFNDIYGNRDHVWLLISPTGSEVSVSEAMKDIASTNSLVGLKAQRWLKENGS